MEKQALIEMLNRDLADEHAAIIRYLVHSYLEGEDSPLGASLLSRSREEMWHMHWLGMIIGKLGGEPNMTPAPYPYDPTSRSTIFTSYRDYENNLIPHYNKEADMVEDFHVRRVLQREAWESAVHARKFQRILGKLSPEQAAGLPGGDNELPPAFSDQLQGLIETKYTQVLQQIRDAWVFQTEGIKGWQLMDFSMTKMKQLAHLAEPVAENGIVPRLKGPSPDRSTVLGEALKNSLEALRVSRAQHGALREDAETQKHAGFIISLDLSIDQEEYEEAEIEGWL
ncbi:ferritin-like domain-containing protein [Thermodesulfobacteriota bacterium]